MSKTFTTGMGGHGEQAMSRRIESLERFIGQFKTVRTVSKNEIGEFRFLEVLCIDRGLASGENILPPFHLTLESLGSGASKKHFVTVSSGVVFDRVNTHPTPFPAPFSPSNIVYSEDEQDLNAKPKKVAGEPKRFEIKVGQKISIFCHVLETGAIGHKSLSVNDLVKVVVGENPDSKSLHYVAPVGDETPDGKPGTHFYELGHLEENDGKVKLKTVMAGSNIDHYRESPILVNTGSGAAVVKDFDSKTARNRFRSIVAGDGILVHQTKTSILISAITSTPA